MSMFDVCARCGAYRAERFSLYCRACRFTAPPAEEGATDG